MPSWTTQRRKTLRRDNFQCQICGDTLTSPHTKLQVHHIIPRAEGGTDELDNLVTLCDLCHAVCHWHMGPAWCGLFKLPLEQQEEAKKVLEEVRKEFQEFLTLPFEERCTIQQKLWYAWSVVNVRRSTI